MDIQAGDSTKMERKLFLPFIEDLLDKGGVEGLQWIDKSKGIFRMPWKHMKRHDYNKQRDSALFRAWAVNSGKFKEEDQDPSRWKINFRSALNTMKHIFVELEEQAEEDCRVFRIASPSDRGMSARRRKAATSAQLVRSQLKGSQLIGGGSSYYSASLGWQLVTVTDASGAETTAWLPVSWDSSQQADSSSCDDASQQADSSCDVYYTNEDGNSTENFKDNQEKQTADPLNLECVPDIDSQTAFQPYRMDLVHSQPSQSEDCAVTHCGSGAHVVTTRVPSPPPLLSIGRNCEEQVVSSTENVAHSLDVCSHKQHDVAMTAGTITSQVEECTSTRKTDRSCSTARTDNLVNHSNQQNNPSLISSELTSLSSTAVSMAMTSSFSTSILSSSSPHTSDKLQPGDDANMSSSAAYDYLESQLALLQQKKEQLQTAVCIRDAHIAEMKIQQEELSGQLRQERLASQELRAVLTLKRAQLQEVESQLSQKRRRYQEQAQRTFGSILPDMKCFKELDQLLFSNKEPENVTHSGIQNITESFENDTLKEPADSGILQEEDEKVQSIEVDDETMSTGDKKVKEN